MSGACNRARELARDGALTLAVRVPDRLCRRLARTRPEDQDVTYWAQNNCAQPLQAWLAAHPAWDINTRDDQGLAPLHWAADRGHVAIARDAGTMIHANGHHMMVAIEPVREALARIKAAGSDVTSIKRL